MHGWKAHMCASIKTNNRCWNVKNYAFRNPFAKYPIFKFTEFAVHYHQTYQMCCRGTLSSLNRHYWWIFTNISLYCWCILMILTFNRVRRLKTILISDLLWIMRSLMNPVMKTLIGDTSELLCDFSISPWFYQFERSEFFPKLGLYRVFFLLLHPWKSV